MTRPSLPLAILRLRRQRREQARRASSRRVHRLSFGLGSLITLALVFLLLAASFGYASLTQDLPPLEILDLMLHPLNGLLLQPTRIYDRTGEHLLATLAPGEEARVFLPYDQFAPSLVQATLAVTQPDLWTSPGFTLEGLRDPASHPTLAQKLAFEFLLAGEPATMRRALRERLLAAQLTAQKGREQVVAWHLNSTDYGNDAWGAQAAAMLYLGKPATALSLGEAALLAAAGVDPQHNPFDAPPEAEAGRLEVLRTLLSLGWITPEEARLAVNEVPRVLPAPAPDQGLLPSRFIDLVLDQLDRQLGPGQVERGGAVILTTIDHPLQLQVECGLRAQLRRLSGDPTTVTAADGSPCDAAALLPPLLPGWTSGEVSPSVLVLDPLAGQVLAAAGDLSPRPAGTTITPFVYLTGFTRGLNPASLVWDVPPGDPLPGQVYQGPVRLRIALANDYLPPAQTVIAQMGPGNVLTTAASFGLEFPAAGLLEQDFELSPLQVGSAYAVLAAGGRQVGQAIAPPGAASTGLEMAAVLRVTLMDGTPWLDWSSPDERSVLSPALAYLLNNILSDEPARWPSLGTPNTLEIGRPAAVRAAHSLDGRAAWTVGGTPQRTVVVYLSGAGSAGRSAADGLWSALVKVATRELPATGWEMPSGVVTLKVCDPSGMLPTGDCPNVVDEVFLEGRQPVQPDQLFQAFEINIETGLLATVFTPPELRERRVYMSIPSQARSWAAAAGIEAPPHTYDYFQAPQVLPDVHLTAPAMFADGRGILQVQGTAAGAGFVFYRLEFGQGLNPQYWTQLGTDATTPVTSGLLGMWDTTGLDGLHSLRLMVVRTGNRLEESLVQLTLDNTPPVVQVLHPQAGQAVDLQGESQVALQAQVQEAYLQEVTFYVDGGLLAALASPPFGVLWTAEAGEHVLVVTATDRAGNTGVAEMPFTVQP